MRAGISWHLGVLILRTIHKNEKDMGNVIRKMNLSDQIILLKSFILQSCATRVSRQFGFDQRYEAKLK